MSVRHETGHVTRVEQGSKFQNFIKNDMKKRIQRKIKVSHKQKYFLC